MGVEVGLVLAEHRGVFGVSVADEVPESLGPVAEVHEQVARLLGHPWPGRVLGGAEHVDGSGGQFDAEEHVGATWRQFLRTQAAGILGCDFFSVDTVLLQPARRGAGPAPPPRRIRQIVLAPTV